jgi:sugar lactone lactonase YvrE
MKTRLSCLIATLALAACSGETNTPPAAPSTAAPAQTAAPAAPAAPQQTPEQAAHAEMIKKAETFTEQQIKQARDPGALSRLAPLYLEAKDNERYTWTLEQLSTLLPNSGKLRLQLAMGYAEAGDKTRVYDTLLKMINQGYAFDISDEPRFENAHGTKVWDYIVERFGVNAQAYGEGKVAFELPKGDTLFEALAWDPKRKQFLVGSVREGAIHLSDGNGKLSDFIKPDATNGLWGVYALAVDPGHDKLYALSNGVPHFQGFNADMVGKAALVEFSLSSGKFLHRYPAPENAKHILSSITVDTKGDVYVADGVNNIIFRLDGGALKTMMGNPSLTGIRGMAVTPDGKTLYFADDILGIFGVDLSKSAAFSLTYNPTKLVLGGIDGLYWYDGTLVAVQANMEPQRVMRLKLSADGRSVESATPIDAAQPAFELPTTGTVVGNDLYFIANSQKAQYGDLGTATDPDKLKAVRVFRSNLRYAWKEGIETSPTAPRPPTHTYTAEELKKMLSEPPKGVIRQPDAAQPTPAPPQPADKPAQH